jgi:hypothetical protein
MLLLMGCKNLSVIKINDFCTNSRIITLTEADVTFLKTNDMQLLRDIYRHDITYKKYCVENKK